MAFDSSSTVRCAASVPVHFLGVPSKSPLKVPGVCQTEGAEPGEAFFGWNNQVGKGPFVGTPWTDVLASARLSLLLKVNN